LISSISYFPGGIIVPGVGAAHYRSFVLDDANWPPRFWKLLLKFNDGTQMAFCDSRRFAKVRFLFDPEHNPPISELVRPIHGWVLGSQHGQINGWGRLRRRECTT
jgi:hypothetical protein